MTELSLRVDREQLAADVQELRSVEPMPTSALRLVNVCQDPGVHTEEIISIIETEPAIAARVLAVANSPLYGYSRQISTIPHAIVILGIKNITRLAVSFAARMMYSGSENTGDFCQRLYKHSLGCALVARNLTDVHDVCDPEQAFLGGLLHDIGKLVLVQVLQEDYIKLTSSAAADQLVELEQESFGFTHEDVGEICAQKWGFPMGVRQAIANHHLTDPKKAPCDLSSVVAAANYLAISEGIGCEPAKLEAHPATKSMLEDLDENHLQLSVESAREEYEVLANAS